MGKFVDSFVSSALTSITSVAATTPGPGLGKISSKVMIDQRNAFVSAAAAMNLEVGDRPFIGKNSMTTENCSARKITASKANVYTVVTQAPCAVGEKTAHLAEDQAFELTADTVPIADIGAAVVIAVLVTHQWTPMSAP